MTQRGRGEPIYSGFPAPPDFDSEWIRLPLFSGLAPSRLSKFTSTAPAATASTTLLHPTSKRGTLDPCGKAMARDHGRRIFESPTQRQETRGARIYPSTEGISDECTDTHSIWQHSLAGWFYTPQGGSTGLFPQHSCPRRLQRRLRHYSRPPSLASARHHHRFHRRFQGSRRVPDHPLLGRLPHSHRASPLQAALQRALLIPLTGCVWERRVHPSHRRSCCVSVQRKDAHRTASHSLHAPTSRPSARSWAASSKGARGARETPVPICPTPGSL